MVGSQKPSRITRQKTCCASESNTSVRVVFANQSGFEAPIGVVLAWEERTSCINIFRMTNHVWISETITNYEAKDLLSKRSVEHVLTYFGRQITVGSQKPSRITRQKTCCASESNTSVRVVFANRSGFDAPIGVVLAWEEHGSCLKYSGRQIVARSQKPSRITRQKTCCASESNTSVRVVFANQSGFDAPIGVVLTLEERGSCLNIFRTTNRGRISETFTNYEANDLLRKRVDHVLTYSGRQITVGSRKPSRITRQKTCCASESNTSVRVVFANQSGFDAPIRVVLAWEERVPCLKIFRTTNHGRITETFTNYEAKDFLRKNLNELRGKRFVAQVSQKRRFALYFRTGVILMPRLESSWHGRSVDHVLNISDDKSRPDLRNLHELRGKRLVAQVSQTRRFALYLRTGVVLMLQLESSWHGRSVDHVSTYSGRQIAVGSQKPSRIMRQKTCCASESNTSVRVVFANRSGFDAPIGVVLALEERGSCLNIFRMTNRGQISETFTNYEAKHLLRKNLRELRGKRLVAQVNQTRRFGLYLRTGVVLMRQLESSWHGRSVDHVLTCSGRKIVVGSQKPSRITRQKTCCASESNTSVRVVFANRSGFDAPIGVVLAWEERGSCLSIFPDAKSRSDLRKFHELRGKRLVAQVSQTRRSALYL
ncbi:uncharacterized protein G2W53_028675 [Senna tora]|uniref:Uncharacterized protein n=1 Tax=Senna tora TaxID=362788 RepID=A0A834T3T3_9FABA|nr:uncharacterized protein G2W53_028675 [Senna tora]